MPGIIEKSQERKGTEKKGTGYFFLKKLPVPFFSIFFLPFFSKGLMRKLYQNSGSFVFFAQCLDGSSMVFYDLFCNWKSETCPKIFR